jgi:hypothetical protein
MAKVCGLFAKNAVKKIHSNLTTLRELRDIVLPMGFAIIRLLESHPCVDCGDARWQVLEFDHVRGTKVANIADMVKDKRAITSIEEEITKCEVRCANCHRMKTHLTLWSTD